MICCILILILCIQHATPGPAVDDQAKHSGSTLVSSTINPHADLPTKFGDEDDVIAKKHAAQLPPETPAGAGRKGPLGRIRKEHAFGVVHTDEDVYDDDEDDEEFGRGGERDESHYKSGDYGDELDEDDDDEDEDSELGPPLENFGDVKLDGGETENPLPILLLEPESTFVIRSRAAVLKCQAAHALKVGEIFL